MFDIDRNFDNKFKKMHNILFYTAVVQFIPISAITWCNMQQIILKYKI